MLIKPEDINKVLELSGNAVSTRGKKYFEKSKVKVAKLDMEDDEKETVIAVRMFYKGLLQGMKQYLQ